MANILITMKNGDTMEAELYPEIAPKTVENFLGLIENKFFDGLIFHRVIEGFMIQGGGYDETGAHDRGVLSMARTMIKDSASSQFFIMHKAAPHLDGEYAAFGKVIKGLEVIDKIATTPTDYMDNPIEPQVIESIREI